MYTGWLCPRCGRVNAPHINYCDCRVVSDEHKLYSEAMWTEARYHLAKMRTRHTAFPNQFSEYEKHALNVLKVRFDDGERTQELYDAIMGLD